MTFSVRYNDVYDASVKGVFRLKDLVSHHLFPHGLCQLDLPALTVLKTDRFY